MKNIFGKFPLIEKTYGKSFGFIPPGLTGTAKVAAEQIVNNAVADFNALTEGAKVTEEALLPVVGTMQTAYNAKIQLITSWGNGY